MRNKRRKGKGTVHILEFSDPVINRTDLQYFYYPKANFFYNRLHRMQDTKYWKHFWMLFDAILSSNTSKSVEDTILWTGKTKSENQIKRNYNKTPVKPTVIAERFSRNRGFLLNRGCFGAVLPAIYTKPPSNGSLNLKKSKATCEWLNGYLPVTYKVCLSAFSVDDRRTGFIIFSLLDPHFLKGAQRR